MDAKEYFINAYDIYHTSNVVNEKKVDLKYIKEGVNFKYYQKK